MLDLEEIQRKESLMFLENPQWDDSPGLEGNLPSDEIFTLLLFYPKFRRVERQRPPEKGLTDG